MNEYSFSDWNEFGIFCRLNLVTASVSTRQDRMNKHHVVTENLRKLLPQDDLTPLIDFNKACLATAGGCGCSKKKRSATAKLAYSKAIKLIKDNNILQTEIKKLLNNPDKIHFYDPELNLSKRGAADVSNETPVLTF